MKSRIPGLLVLLILAGGLMLRGGTSRLLPVPVGETRWVDSVFASLTPDERIAQLMMVAAYSNRSLDYNAKVTEQIRKYNIGGIIFFQGGPVMQARYTNYWQSMSKTPLLIAIDGEWGLGMRLKDSAVSFPKQMTLGAIRDNSLIYETGAEMARQFTRLGIHVNFSPVADINSNPSNPVINYRSFGQDKVNVAAKALALMKGMQENGLLAVGKHFPGHGDTDQDSHKTLPEIDHDLNTLDSVDSYPFRILIKNGISSVMVAHLFVPVLDSAPGVPSTLSRKIITDYLIRKLGFKGLIFTDALGMKGLTQNIAPGEAEVKALLAGNDILLMPEDVPLAMENIKKAIADSLISQKTIDERCRKLLRYKYRAGLWKKQRVNLNGLTGDLAGPLPDNLNERLYNAALTLLYNRDNILPLPVDGSRRVLMISFNSDSLHELEDMTANYAGVCHYYPPPGFSADSVGNLMKVVRNYDIVVVNVHATGQSRGKDNYGFSDAALRLIDSAGAIRPLVLNLMANPYALGRIRDTSGVKAILVAYQTNAYSRRGAAQALYAGLPVNGRLPVSAGRFFPVNTGVDMPASRLGYCLPGNQGLHSDLFRRIDSMAMKGISDTVYPGCQILVAYKGKIVHRKSYGYHTYERKSPVQNSDLYDLASITKVAATTISVMKLYEEGRIDVDEKLVKYLPEIDSSNKAAIIIRSLMAHQAGLQPWIPFYRKTMTGGLPDSCIYRRVKSAAFPYRVADSLYIAHDYPDTIFYAIIRSDLRGKFNYRYSDLGFYLLKEIIERQTNMTIDRYVAENFYKPLGLMTMCYQPRKYFDLDRLIPSEKDTAFRKQTLWGDVNDPGAAMQDGVGGHAGLFSNSYDVAVLFQMLLREGEYGGRRYFKPETVRKFTAYQYDGNRRGMGFDKPVRDNSGGPTCREVSPESYGHTGFTGTFVWADPRYQLIYVFLSNRTYPYSAKNKLMESGIRENIQKVLYQEIIRQQTNPDN